MSQNMKEITSETGRPYESPESDAFTVSIEPRRGDPGIKNTK